MNPTIAAKIRGYIVERFLFGQGAEKFDDDTSFLEYGLIDSTGILEVVMFLEEQYGIKVADEDLVPENLDSVSRIVRFIERKSA
jgi:acyl carrier protein